MPALILVFREHFHSFYNLNHNYIHMLYGKYDLNQNISGPGIDGTRESSVFLYTKMTIFLSFSHTPCTTPLDQHSQTNNQGVPHH